MNPYSYTMNEILVMFKSINPKFETYDYSPRIEIKEKEIPKQTERRCLNLRS